MFLNLLIIEEHLIPSVPSHLHAF